MDNVEDGGWKVALVVFRALLFRGVHEHKAHIKYMCVIADAVCGDWPSHGRSAPAPTPAPAGQQTLLSPLPASCWSGSSSPPHHSSSAAPLWHRTTRSLLQSLLYYSWFDCFNFCTLIMLLFSRWRFILLHKHFAQFILQPCKSRENLKKAESDFGHQAVSISIISIKVKRKSSFRG